MPFDALVTSTATTSQIISDMGIAPIPRDDLRVYKEAEAAKHPASFLANFVENHIDAIQIGIFCVFVTAIVAGLIGIVGTFVSFFAQFNGETTAMLFLGWFGVAIIGGGLAIGIFQWETYNAPTPFRGAAEWGETYYPNLRRMMEAQTVPLAIFAIAKDVQARFPQAGF